MEKFIIGSNGSGKTQKMLQEAKNSGAIVVCKYPLHMQDKANSYGIYGLEFISYDDMRSYPVYGKKFAIDELCDFFKYYFSAQLDSFTMTVD